MRFCRDNSLTAFAALSISTFALANTLPAGDESPAAQTTAPVKDYAIQVSANVGTRLTLMESHTGRRPFFNGELPSAGFRLGLKAEYGVGFAESQIRYGGALDRFDKGGDSFIGKENKGSILVNKANAGMRFASGTSFTLGRFALVDPASYTSEAADVGIDGVGGLDGFMVAQKFGSGNEFVNLQVFAANRIGTMDMKESKGAPEADFMARPKNDTLAFGGSVQGKLDIIQGDAFVAYQAKHISEFNQNGVLMLKSDQVATEAVKEFNKSFTANVGDMFTIGGTLGLDLNGVSFGAGYEYKSLTNRRYAKVNDNGSLTRKPLPRQEGLDVEATINNARNLELYQVATGMNVKSSYFGVKDLLISGDTLIGGISYSHRGRSVSKVALPKYNEVAAHVGYEDGHLQTVLGVRYMTQGRQKVMLDGKPLNEKTYSLLNGGPEGNPINDSTTIFARVSYAL